MVADTLHLAELWDILFCFDVLQNLHSEVVLNVEDMVVAPQI